MVSSQTGKKEQARKVERVQSQPHRQHRGECEIFHRLSRLGSDPTEPVVLTVGCFPALPGLSPLVPGMWKCRQGPRHKYWDWKLGVLLEAAALYHILTS